MQGRGRSHSGLWRLTMTQQMAAYRAIIAEMNEAGHGFPSLENEGGSAHPWARDCRCLLRSKSPPPLGAGNREAVVGENVAS